jgi:glutamate-1-semialdehyde 2,1-aminomutase
MDHQSIIRQLAQEQTLFARLHPRSQKLFEQGQQHFLYGAPSHWMRRWAGGFPLYVNRAAGAHLRCVDGSTT